MWPWGHLALGYLFYAGYVWARYNRAPLGWPVVALALGTQFPDLVDKPLAYWFGVLPGGRSLAHSVLLFLPLGFVVLTTTMYYRRTDIGEAFLIGWASHLVGDSVYAIVEGRYVEVLFLIWPAVPAPEYRAANFPFHLRQLLSSLSELDLATLLSPTENAFVLELWIAGAVTFLWIMHGMPPIELVRRFLSGKRDDPRGVR